MSGVFWMLASIRTEGLASDDLLLGQEKTRQNVRFVHFCSGFFACIEFEDRQRERKRKTDRAGKAHIFCRFRNLEVLFGASVIFVKKFDSISATLACQAVPGICSETLNGTPIEHFRCYFLMFKVWDPRTRHPVKPNLSIHAGICSSSAFKLWRESLVKECTRLNTKSLFEHIMEFMWPELANSLEHTCVWSSIAQ